MDAFTGSGEVPVEEGHRVRLLTEIAVDGVLRRQVVVADDVVAAGQRCPRGEVVQLADQLGDPDQARVGPDGRAVFGLPGNVPVEEAEDLPVLLVDAEQPRRPRPALPVEEAEQTVDELGPGRARPAHGVADPDDRVHEAAGQGLFGHVHLQHDPQLTGSCSFYPPTGTPGHAGVHLGEMPGSDHHPSRTYAPQRR